MVMGDTWEHSEPARTAENVHTDQDDLWLGQPVGVCKLLDSERLAVAGQLVSWWIPPGGGTVRSAAVAPWVGCGAQELGPTPATEVGPLCRAGRAPVPKEYGPWEGVAG